MKEKIWIEKLIELYYEYKLDLLKRDMRVNWATEREIEMADIEKVEEEELEENLNKLSDLKPFIKWLVENDKIDTSKANDKNLNGYEIELRIRAVKELVADSEEKTVLYLNLLMLLAIQDEPIRFLCEILK